MKNKKITHKKRWSLIALGTLFIGAAASVLGSSSVLLNTSLPSKEISMLADTPTSTPTPAPTPAPTPTTPYPSIKPELSLNPYHRDMFSVNTQANIIIRDKAPESITNEEWKQFVVKNNEALFGPAPASTPFPESNITVTKVSASNALHQAVISIKETSPARVISELTVTGFRTRPNLPSYLNADHSIDVIDGSAVGLNKIGTILTSKGYIDGKTINEKWYPFNYVDAFINNNSDLYNRIKQIAIDEFTFNPNNEFTADSSIELELPNYTSPAIQQYKETGVFETLNNASTGNESEDLSQLKFDVTFKNIKVNGTTIYNQTYPLYLFNAKNITNEPFNPTADIKTAVSDLPESSNIGATLDDLNVSNLLKSLSYYTSGKKNSDLPPSIVTLHEGTTPIKNYADNSVAVRVDITNIIHNDANKYIGNLSDVRWTISGFVPPTSTPDSDANLSSTFNKSSIYRMNAPASIADFLPDDVTPSQVTNIVTPENILTMFSNLPADFVGKVPGNYYVIDSLEPDHIKNELKVNISLTYAKVSNHNVLDLKGTAVSGYFIIQNFATAKNFSLLTNTFNAPTKEDIYQFDPIDPIRKHLFDYVNGTRNCFPTMIKNELLKFLNDELDFRDNIRIVSKDVAVSGAFKTNPKLTIKVNSSKIASITGDATFATLDGYQFNITNFLEYQPTEVAIVNNSFPNYTYEDFADEVNKGNIGVNKKTEKNNLANITNLPNDKIPPILSVSKIHSTGLNAKAIVSIKFKQFYSEEGLREDYTYNMVVALHTTGDPLANHQLFNSDINISDIDTAGGKKWKEMTAPLAAEYFNDIANQGEIKTTLNNPAVAPLLFNGEVPPGYNISLSSATLMERIPNTIALTLSNNNGLLQTVTLTGFANINGATTVASTLPAGTDFSTLKVDFSSLTGSALDTKAKTFLTVDNAVNGYVVKAVNVVNVVTNSLGQETARISFQLSAVYVSTGIDTYKIVNDVIYQFEYISSSKAAMSGKLISTSLDNDTASLNTNMSLIISLSVVGSIALLVMLLYLVKFLKKRK